MAMEFWPQEELEQALGDDITRVMPELVRLAELHVPHNLTARGSRWWEMKGEE